MEGKPWWGDQASSYKTLQEKKKKKCGIFNFKRKVKIGMTSITRHSFGQPKKSYYMSSLWRWIFTRGRLSVIYWAFQGKQWSQLDSCLLKNKCLSVTLCVFIRTNIPTASLSSEGGGPPSLTREAWLCVSGILPSQPYYQSGLYIWNGGFLHCFMLIIFHFYVLCICQKASLLN